MSRQLDQECRRGSRSRSRSSSIIRPATREEVPRLLAAADLGIFLIKPVFSKTASSPTKMGEMLAVGLPIVANAGVGDVEQMVERYGLWRHAAVTSAHELRDGARSAWRAEGSARSGARSAGTVRRENRSRALRPHLSRIGELVTPATLPAVPSSGECRPGEKRPHIEIERRAAVVEVKGMRPLQWSKRKSRIHSSHSAADRYG